MWIIKETALGFHISALALVVRRHPTLNLEIVGRERLVVAQEIICPREVAHGRAQHRAFGRLVLGVERIQVSGD